MKKIIIIAFVFLSLWQFDTICAQKQIITEEELPAVVKNAFDIAYSKTKVTKWELINQQYFAYVKTKTAKEVACFSPNGTWIETRGVIENEKLPFRASEFLKKEYPAYFIYYAAYVEQKEGKPYYFVQLNLKINKNIRVDLSFDLAGQLSSVDGLSVIKNKDTNNSEIAVNTELVQNAITTAANGTTLPEVVELAFKKRFPRTEKVFWKKEDQLQVVQFTMNEREQEAAYFNSGEHIYTASFFDKKMLPLPIERYLTENYPKFSLNECKRVVYESKYKRTLSEKPKDYYRVIITEKIPKSKERKKTLLRFDQVGQFDYKADYEGL